MCAPASWILQFVISLWGARASPADPQPELCPFTLLATLQEPLPPSSHISDYGPVMPTKLKIDTGITEIVPISSRSHT